MNVVEAEGEQFERFAESSGFDQADERGAATRSNPRRDLPAICHRSEEKSLDDRDIPIVDEFKPFEELRRHNRSCRYAFTLKARNIALRDRRPVVQHHEHDVPQAPQIIGIEGNTVIHAAY